ncbi:hypothetical protein QBC46DRAFT_397207 [Diplogelasinospora grovesii]|uniref:Thiaminase-2/PQQC domain-containing protein n=1 Tax=Diplogelasinospora grovesii TaxID=303347 RepID=A0AAN6MXY4_9PEZI|nr:hypothetical protein QBC46DRAFT_397207 [Diplogelasinospora grovesii]
MAWSLTEHLLTTYSNEYKVATQAPFLLAAAEGRLPKDVLGRWLANDRLYIHSYIRAAGKMLSTLDLPPTVPKTEAYETQLVDWLVEALGAVRREERLFIDVSERYELPVNLPTTTIGISSTQGGKEVVDPKAKLAGLVMIEDDVFGNIIPQTQTQERVGEIGVTSAPPPLPWLEAAVTFWGTERCYLDAWSWAKSKQTMSISTAIGEKGGMGINVRDDYEKDADGGALRKEFIPNWSSVEFAQFVGRLGSIIDFAVAEVLEKQGEGAKEEILQRVEGKWKTLLAAEATFWPQVE